MNDISIISNETLYYLRSNLVLFIVAIRGATPLMKVVIGNLKEKCVLADPHHAFWEEGGQLSSVKIEPIRAIQQAD